MIIDFTVENFRSIRTEQTLSMNVESGRERHEQNYSVLENGKLTVLRSAAILGANASGKSTLLLAFSALRWIIVESGTRTEGQKIPCYEPFRLDKDSQANPVRLEVEFILQTGIRYRYGISFLQNRIISEDLYSFAKRQRSLVFIRTDEDTWETIKFGGNYKGGNRRFSFFPNQSYLSRAGNDASSPEFIRNIFRYFEYFDYFAPGYRFITMGFLNSEDNMRAVSDLICLSDTGVTKVTAEENKNIRELKLPEDMPSDLKEMIIENNKIIYKFWMESTSGKLIEFDQDSMSDGTIRLFEILPLVLISLSRGSVLLIDEIDAHLHTDVFSLVLSIFNDSELNRKNAQIIFTTHDTNILNSDILRRDQIWLVEKIAGASHLSCLDEYDKRYVRADSPFEAFYRDGRLGALPKLDYPRIRDAILRVISNEVDASSGGMDAEA